MIPFFVIGEMKFFDGYVIPLAKKLKECNIFGVSSDECLNNAMRNRMEWEDRGRKLNGNQKTWSPCNSIISCSLLFFTCLLFRLAVGAIVAEYVQAYMENPLYCGKQLFPVKHPEEEKEEDH